MRIQTAFVLLVLAGLAVEAHAQSPSPATSGADAETVQAPIDAKGPALAAQTASGDFVQSAVTGVRIVCTNGRAGAFPCRNVDLLSYLPISQLGGDIGTRMNDIWGWTDLETGREYALVGRSDGTAFVDVTNPQIPRYLGSLPSVDGAESSWRDVKTVGNFAFIVMDFPSDGVRHGMQVFDLTELRNVTSTPKVFSESARYTEFSRAHNIVANEETEFVYAVGTETCGGGLHLINVRNPLNPTFAGCFAESGYTHDAQCVVYEGPDTEYRGREICIGFNADHVVIADVTEKRSVQPISMTVYPQSRYTHQGWLTPDHRYLLIDDELDELQDSQLLGTRTLVFDVIDLDDPILVREYVSALRSSDHNQYVHRDRAYQANYTSGLRVLDIGDVSEPREVGFFDTYPADDRSGFRGAWSNYPFFESGIVVVNNIGEGLFILDPTGLAATDIANEDQQPTAFELLAAYPNPFNPATTITLSVNEPQHVRVAVFDVQGREVAVLHDGFVETASVRELSFEAGDLASGIYLVRADGANAAGSIAITLQK